MEIWLDTIDLNAIKDAEKLGWLTGVTTNPAILSSSGQVDQALLDLLLEGQSGRVAVQVTTNTADQMLEEAQRLFKLSDRFLIKIPVNKEGLYAMHACSKEGIPTLGTAVFHSHQVLLAALAGAAYVAPYVSHMSKQGIDVWKSLNAMQDVLNRHPFTTKIMAASLTGIDEIIRSAQLGIDAATLPEKLFASFIEDVPLSQEATQKLQQTWQQHCGDRSFVQLLTAET